VFCTGTACYIKGADKLVEALLARYKVKPGETTSDNRLSVLSARCVGACGLAPAAVLDGQMLADQAPDELVGKIEELS
jgi:bidirectional [NiFe] hydrogenase diaphorase subunit